MNVYSHASGLIIFAMIFMTFSVHAAASNKAVEKEKLMVSVVYEVEQSPAQADVLQALFDNRISLFKYIDKKLADSSFSLVEARKFWWLYR